MNHNMSEKNCDRLLEAVREMDADTQAVRVDAKPTGTGHCKVKVVIPCSVLNKQPSEK